MYLLEADVNSLVERFRVPENLRTKAALWLDDDIIISPEDVEFGFRAWQAFGRERHQIVGFSGRQHKITRNVYHYAFEGPTYSMVLTDSAFLDTTMMSWFWAEDARIKTAITYVDEHLNCEDILMNCKCT